MSKKIIITKAHSWIKEITGTNQAIFEVSGPDEMQVSDGDHTMDELYEHRYRLHITLCKTIADWLQNEGNAEGRQMPWCSVLHSDGTKYDDWFLLGMGKETGKQISYHLPARFWNEVCEFAEVLERAPKWDGHTANDVVERLKNL